MNLLYFTIGDKPWVHAQAAYSIYSFLRNRSLIQSISVFTDHPELYERFGTPVRAIKITQDEIDEMAGPFQFFWRVKIRLIERTALNFPGKCVMYLDSDTFLVEDMAGLEKILASGKALMHLNEGQLKNSKNPTERRMWSKLSRASPKTFNFPADSEMWNAGIVSFPNTQFGKECSLAISACDEMCKLGVERRLVEQFALTLSLNKFYGLVEAREYVAHYWSVKSRWNNVIDRFFVEAFLARLSEEKIIEAIGKTDHSALPTYAKESQTKKRMMKLLDKLFPENQAVFTRRSQ